MICRHGNDVFVCMENGCMSPDRNMSFVIRENAPDYWHFVLLDASGEPVYVSPARFRTAEDCAGTVAALRATDRRTPVTVVRTAPVSPALRKERGAI